MLRIKKHSVICGAMSLFCALSLIGCQSGTTTVSDKDISEMLMTNVIADNDISSSNIYNTETVIIGDITETIAASGSIRFVNTENLTQPFSYGTVTFVKYNINSLGYTFVTEGSVIATLKLNIDAISREEARIKLEKAQNSYKNSLEKKTASLEKLKSEIDNAQNIYDKQLLELDYSEELEAYNEYVAAQEQQLAELEEKVTLYSNESATIELVAPCDGMVTNMAKFSTGDIIDYDTRIATIYKTDEIIVTSRSNDLKYGSDVEIVLVSGNDRITFYGEVVCAPNILSAASGVTTTIAVTSGMPDISTVSMQSLQRMSVLSYGTYITDGIIIPSGALFSSSGSSGVVYVYRNGAVNRTNVKIGYSGRDFVWVPDGLTPGQEVTIK